MQVAKWIRVVVSCAAVSASCPAAWAGPGEGLQPNIDVLWPRLQARVSLGTPMPAWRNEWGVANSQGLKPSRLTVMGDYYFSRTIRPDGAAGGFRATSGLVVGPRAPAALGPAETATVPYVGVGYSGLGGRSGWSFNADFGLTALSPGNGLRVGRVLSGSQGLDDLVRDLRLTPTLQLGATYSF
jgi:hypothetical protein